jgi:uncharacterized protein YbdZ (MbtH family)
MAPKDLPAGWKQLTAPSGQPYYENTARHSTQWVHPLHEPLPRGWRVSTDPHNHQPFYLNDTAKATQWDHPCKVLGEAVVLDAPPPPRIVEWEVEVERGWFPFHPATNRQVAQALAEGKTQVAIGNSRVVDLTTMEQLRTDTNTVRPLVALCCVTPPTAHPAP